MKILTRSMLPVLLLMLSVSVVMAQSWRGMGRVAGKVTDESGKPLEAVVVKLNLPGSGGTEVKTNKKGEWSVGGIARGMWQIDFTKETYESRQISVMIQELSRIPPVEIALKQNETEVVRIEVQKAAALVGQQKWAEARAVYQAILDTHPNYTGVYPFLAQTYYSEKNYDEAIKYLKIAVEKDPGDQTNQMLLANVLMQTGRLDEGRKVMDTVDDAQIKDPAVYVNIGINLLNQNKAAEALPYFEKAITHFPSAGDGYYYRALVRLQQGDTAGTKEDLTKFLELAPDSSDAPAARKALEQLKK